MFSGNFPEDLTFQAISSPVNIYMNGELILSEVYDHAGNYTIHLRLRELFDSLLTVKIPTNENVLIQEAAAANFAIEVEIEDVLTQFSFRLVKGGLDTDKVDCTDFLWTNFLTWMPRVKKVKENDPQWLTYYSVQEAQLFFEATFMQDGALHTSAPMQLYILPELKVCTMNVNFEHIWSQVDLDGRLPYFIDVWIQDEGGLKKTYSQRYVIYDDFHEFDDLCCFVNSLGGVDIIRFTGEFESELKHEFKNAKFRDEYQEFDILLNTVFKKNTGYFHNPYEMMWTSDFFSSIERYHLSFGQFKRIIVKEYEAVYKKTILNSFTFSFSYARESKYLNNNILSAGALGALNEFPGMQQLWDDIYVKIFGNQLVDGTKTFLQPVKANTVIPASGSSLILNDLVVEDGGIIDCGEF